MRAVTCHLHHGHDAEALVGALHAARFPSYDIVPERDGLLVSVHTSSVLEQVRAIDIMREYGAEDVETEREPFSRRWHILRELPRL